MVDASSPVKSIARTIHIIHARLSIDSMCCGESSSQPQSIEQEEREEAENRLDTAVMFSHLGIGRAEWMCRLTSGYLFVRPARLPFNYAATQVCQCWRISCSSSFNSSSSAGASTATLNLQMQLQTVYKSHGNWHRKLDECHPQRWRNAWMTRRKLIKQPFRWWTTVSNQSISRRFQHCFRFESVPSSSFAGKLVYCLL